MEVLTVEHAPRVRRIPGASRRGGRLDTAGRAIPDPVLRPAKPTPSSGPDRTQGRWGVARARAGARPVPDQGGIAMGSGAKRFRVQHLGLSGRDALLLLEALGGQAAHLDLAPEALTPGTLAARIGGMDPRDAFRVEGWVAGFRDAEDHGGASTARRAARAERAGATVH